MFSMACVRRIPVLVLLLLAEPVHVQTALAVGVAAFHGADASTLVVL
jgi:hypothetical protein